MSYVNLLSDTTYREQAVKQLDKLLHGASKFPVESSQIYGLRQISRQQPDKVLDFARHQHERAEKLGKQDEVGFWQLVEKLCDRSTTATDWSVDKEGHTYLPEELRSENIPPRRQGMTQEEQRQRNELRNNQRTWLNQWANEHIPAFFERFCTHCLYRKVMIETSQINWENDPPTHQDQNEPQNSNVMQTAFTDVGLQK